jgi:hypothetical protein
MLSTPKTLALGTARCQVLSISPMRPTFQGPAESQGSFRFHQAHCHSPCSLRDERTRRCGECVLSAMATLTARMEMPPPPVHTPHLCKKPLLLLVGWTFPFPAPSPPTPAEPLQVSGRALSHFTQAALAVALPPDAAQLREHVPSPSTGGSPVPDPPQRARPARPLAGGRSASPHRHARARGGSRDRSR